jgi:hypothetical protein
MTAITASIDLTTTETSAAALVIDLPNLNGHLRELAGGRSGPTTRCDFQALIDYFLQLEPRATHHSVTVFMQVGNQPQNQAGFITALRNMGIGVYARPDGDIDDNLAAHVDGLARSLAHVCLITHDRELISRCVESVGARCSITVLGLEEFAAAVIRDRRLAFVDLGDVPGVISQGLSRTSLRHLPPDGALLPPLRALRSMDRCGERAA